MGRIIKGHYSRQFRPTPYPIPSKRYDLEKIDWEQAICSVCLEAPHNAVLLLCSSHDKGCRPYMCGTGFRHSNCLDLFKKAYAKPAIKSSLDPQVHSSSLGWPLRKKSEPTELSCPLCRGEVKGWTVVNPARKHLNRNKRGCIHEGCSFTGTYKELKKHVKAKHRRAKPRKVDPLLEAKWRALEMQTAEQDVLSTIRSTTPGALVMGDFVIEMDSSGSDMDDFDDDEDDDDSAFDYGGGGGEGRGFPRRGYVDRDFPWTYVYYYLLQDRAQLRMQRDNVMLQDGGTSGAEVGYQPEGDDIEDGGDWSRGRPTNMMRDGRRRQGRSRVRSRFALG